MLLDMNDPSPVAVSKLPTIKADYLEAGSGPVVMLVHSSVSGARQWRRLMDELKDEFHVRAVNLYGYGKTPPWSSDAPQSLDDQARLVETALPTNADNVCLVGHSFGGSVAMKLAARLAGRVSGLVLLETNPFYLLEQSGRADAFAEAMDLRNWVKKFGADGRVGDGGRTIRRLLGWRRVMAEHAGGTAPGIC